MSYEDEFDDEPIQQIADREFGDNEFMVRVKHNKVIKGGHFKVSDRANHFKRMKKVFQ